MYDDDNDLASFRDSRGGDSTDAESRIGDDVGGHNLHHVRGQIIMGSLLVPDDQSAQVLFASFWRALCRP